MTGARRSQIAWLVVVVVLIGGLAALGASPDFRREVRRSISRQAGGFSELAFVDPVDLPSTLARGATTRMTFSITNQTGSVAAYDVSAVADNGAAPVTLLHEKVSVDDGDTAIRTLTFAPTSAGHYRVEVTAGRYRIHRAVEVP
jgi:hypothetical protein